MVSQPLQNTGVYNDNNNHFSHLLNNPEEPIDVLDLPPIHRKPSAETLLNYLSLIALQPPSWDAPTPALSSTSTCLNSITSTNTSTTSQPQRNQPRPIHGNPTKWLTNIVASPLNWITDEDLQERVRDVASTRLSERCGRTAMPAVTRTFKILNEFENGSGDHDKANIATEEVQIVLHEPTMDGDNLGLKTWGAAYMLAKRLGSARFRRLVGLEYSSTITSSPQSPPAVVAVPAMTNKLRILELGSGTGLVGIAAAVLLSSSSTSFPSSLVSPEISIHLTDLPEVVPNLTKNISLNLASLANTKTAIKLTAGVLDWRTHVNSPTLNDKYPLILVADPLYSKEHPRWLSDVVSGWLERSERARVVVELPLREVYVDVVRDFWTLMGEKRLLLVEEGEEMGRDDWGDGAEGQEMKCWWGVWRWGTDDVNG